MTDPSARAPVVAILGTGVMGSAMARNAARAGMTVRAWSRPASDAERLAGVSITAHPTAADAAATADLVVTMVPDAAAIDSFATGPDGFLAAMAADAVWIQSSTVGAAPADRLVALAGELGVALVDAPVLGSKDPAERGELVILASGDDDALDRCEPFFAAIGRQVLRLGPAGAGSRLKMVTNTWIVSCVAVVAESMALAETLGLDGRVFLEAIAGTAMDTGYAQIKGGMIAAREFPVQMTLANGAKDARLALATARDHGLPARMVAAAEELMRTAADAGHANDDMAAAFFGATPTSTPTAGGSTR